MWALTDGKARPIDGLPVEDRGFLLGDGVFETFRIARGRIRHSDPHAASLASACAALDLPVPDWAGIERAIAGVTGADGERVGKLILTRGGGGRGLAPIPDPDVRLFFEHFPVPPRPEAIRLALVDLRRSASSLAVRFKTLSYADNLAARREAVARGGDVALLLTESGLVSGADSANLFWEQDGQVFTPSTGCGIRNGVMRQCVMRWLEDAGWPAEEIEAGPDTLMAARSVWITNSVGGVMPVSAIDGQVFEAASDVLDRLRAADL
ncbi:aminotransferase class IV [Hyphobacterium sp.]|uniref:aminotransferase class IV n=1 Tax=Hyphobacterium sp. TaxID=2004662 RepID=UPI003749DA1E